MVVVLKVVMLVVVVPVAMDVAVLVIEVPIINCAETTSRMCVVQPPKFELGWPTQRKTCWPTVRDLLCNRQLGAFRRTSPASCCTEKIPAEDTMLLFSWIRKG